MVKKIYVKDMPEKEWLDLRSKYITSSTAADCLGLGYSTATERYYEMIEQPLETPETPESQIIAMMVGTDLEPTVAKIFTMATGKKVSHDDYMYISEKYPWLACNPDYRVVGENAVLECKTTSGFNGNNWDGDILPAHILVQAYLQKIVMELEKVYVCCLIGNNKYEIKVLEDDEYFENLIIEGTETFFKCVQRKTPPDENNPTNQLIRALFPEAEKEKTIDLPESKYLEKIKRYNIVKNHLKEINAEKTKLKYDIMQGIQDSALAFCGEYKINCRNRKDGKRNFLIKNIKEKGANKNE